MPANIVTNFGNSSSATIPMLISYNYSNILTQNTKTICCAGFGAGLTFAGFITDIGPLNTCQLLEYTE